MASNNKTFLLALEADNWQVANLSKVATTVPFVDQQALGSETLGQVRQVLTGCGYRNKGVCLGLPSAMVLSASIQCGDLPRKGRFEAMLYRLEEQLPVNVENITAAFGPEVNGKTIGFAVVTSEVEAIIGQLSEAGIEVAAICPTALLALRAGIDAKEHPADFGIVIEPDAADVFTIDTQGYPTSWQSCDSQISSIARMLEANLLARPAESPAARAELLGHIDPELPAKLTELTGIECYQRYEKSALELACGGAAEILKGETTGLINLRTGPLAVGSVWAELAGRLKTAAILSILLGGMIAGMFIWRAQQYDASADQSKQMQKMHFSRLYPERKVPLLIRKYLASESKRLSGVKGAGQELPHRPNALETLATLAGNIPSNIRMRATEIRVGPRGIILQGQSLTHSDAELIAGALRDGGFKIDPPKTESLESGGVAFTLVGRPNRPDVKEAGK